jgi:hypothetical protein
MPRDLTKVVACPHPRLMRHISRRYVASFATALIVACAPPQTPTAAAARLEPALTWKADATVSGDFTCRGRTEHAVLGTGGGQIVVAIFTEGLAQQPVLLRFPAAMRDPATSTLVAESLDIDVDRLSREIGVCPNGLRPSKTCKGLNLSDGKVGSAHIYWNHDAEQFAAWSL